MKKEAQFTSKFRLWAIKNLPTGAYELKHTRGKPKFYTRELKEHQYMFLCAANGSEGMAYKIPDDSRAYKPFDIVVLRDVMSAIVIRFPEGTVLIHVLSYPFSKKSITYAQALEYGKALSI